MPGRLSKKIFCEAISKLSGKPCRAKGYFTPTSRRFLCRFHGGAFSTDSKTRKYKGLFKNNNVTMEFKIKRLKNLKNFSTKSEDEIKRYIEDQEKRAVSKRYRTKYFTRNYLRWRSTLSSNKRSVKSELEDLLQVFRNKSKVQK